MTSLLELSYRSLGVTNGRESVHRSNDCCVEREQAPQRSFFFSFLLLFSFLLFFLSFPRFPSFDRCALRSLSCRRRLRPPAQRLERSDKPVGRVCANTVLGAPSRSPESEEEVESVAMLLPLLEADGRPSSPALRLLFLVSMTSGSPRGSQSGRLGPLGAAAAAAG